MNEDSTEVRKSAINEFVKILIQGALSLLGVVMAFLGITKETIMAWLRGFHFTDATISHIRVWFFIVGVIMVIACVAWFIRLMTRKEKPKQPTEQPRPQPTEFPAPPALSNIPRKGKPFLGFGPEETILGDLTFEVLKTYSRFPSPNAAMSVKMVCDMGGYAYDEALAAVQELHRMKYIRTLIAAPGNWNGHFQITPIGRDYVNRHAT
jgi:hypothetical protein